MNKPMYFWLMSVFSLALGFAGGSGIRDAPRGRAGCRARGASIGNRRQAPGARSGIRGQANKVDEMRDDAITRLRSESEIFAPGERRVPAAVFRGHDALRTPAVAPVSLGLRSVLGMGVSQTPGPTWRRAGGSRRRSSRKSTSVARRGVLLHFHGQSRRRPVSPGRRGSRPVSDRRFNCWC